MACVNHMAPGAIAIPKGFDPANRIGYSVMAPDKVIRTILSSSYRVNRAAPSGPGAISAGPAAAGTGNSVMAPAMVMRPTLTPLISVNHMAPSGPAAMPNAAELGVGM